MYSSRKVSLELLGMDQAIRRAALTAKHHAVRYGSPYVLVQTKNRLELQESERKIKQ